MILKLLRYMFGHLSYMLSNEHGFAGLRGDQVALYRKDMYKAEREGMLEVPTMYNKITKVVSGAQVDGAGNKKTQLLGPGQLDRHTVEGQNIRFKSPVEGWTTYVKYHTYSAGLIFSFESIQDTVKLGNMIKELAALWGRETRIAKETLVSTAFNDGGDLLGSFVFNGSYTGETDPSGDLLYDSKPFFNLTGNARTTKGGGTYYNSVAGLTATAGNFETVYNLATATNNRDEEDRVAANPVDTVLTKPGADHFAFNRILLSEHLAGGQLNDKNPYVGLIKNIWAWDYLDESAFYVGKAQHPSIEFHERMAPLMDFFRNNENAGYMASNLNRFGIWFKDGAWRAWTRGGGSSA